MLHSRKPLAIRMGPESKGPTPPQEEVLGRDLAAAPPQRIPPTIQ